MKSFLRNVFGAIAIITVATLIGILHNTVRGKPMRLFPRLQSETSISDPGKTSLGDKQAKSEGNGETRKGNISGDLNQTEPGIVSIEQMMTLLDDPSVNIIDARGEEAYKNGHIPGAINIPHDRFVEYYNYIRETIPLDAPIICYCMSQTCDFSDHLAEELRIMGYENVKIYRDGWDTWEEAGYPVEP